MVSLNRLKAASRTGGILLLGLLHWPLAGAQGGDEAFGHSLALQGRPIKGQQGAPLTLVEFIDYRSPWALTAAEQTMPELRRHYLDSGKIRFTVMHFPVYPGAEGPAYAAECARQQGQFWPFHRALLASGGDAQKAMDSLGTNLDRQALDRCMTSQAAISTVSSSKALAQQLGLSGAPSFVLAAPNPHREDQYKVVKTLPGARLQPIQQAIDQALAVPPRFPPEPAPPQTAPAVLTVHEVTLTPSTVDGGKPMRLSWEITLSAGQASPVEFYYEIESQGRTVYRSERRSLDVAPDQRIKKTLKVKTAKTPGQYTLISRVRLAEELHETRREFTVR